MTELRRSSPAALRNRAAIQEAASPHLPARGTVLEIASGSGEHIVYLAAASPSLAFQPTDADPGALESIAARVADEGLTNVRPPVLLDVMAPWPVEAADAVLCINMIHIAPWAATPALMRGAGAVLPEGGPLILYGPFIRPEIETAPSNLAFDADLKRRDPQWGLRDLPAVAREAADAGFGAPHVTEMPANNCLIRFERLTRL
ncbi:MAG: DUF938 domain-containing protein [Pseudomonadota bacterium]